MISDYKIFFGYNVVHLLVLSYYPVYRIRCIRANLPELIRQQSTELTGRIAGVVFLTTLLTDTMLIPIFSSNFSCNYNLYMI